MRKTILVLVLLAAPFSVYACLWDRDTPADEARGLPTLVVAALTGRFERNPQLYYEMRLDRVTALLEEHPDDLNAYDDAGVACDRLGRGEEAIAWMAKKRRRLDSLPPDATDPTNTEHWYRYHANLGTFLVHHWAREGADRTRIDEVKAARDQIARALEINPQAHFGREKYQLVALAWIIDPPSTEGIFQLPNLLGWDPSDIYGGNTDPQMADDAVRGLAGLVVLGNAWESVDIFHALNIALQRDSVGFERGREGGRNTLAYLAWLRCRELIDTGKGSLLPGSPQGEQLKTLLASPGFVSAQNVLDEAFPRLRAEADAWHAARTAFMVARLHEGRHPDTDPNFWSGYSGPPAPELPAISVPQDFENRQARKRTWILAGAGAVTVLLASLLILGNRRTCHRRPNRREEDL